MLKKLLPAIATAGATVALLLATGLAHAAVDVNKSDQAALDGIRGIGPATSKRILEERQRGGDFKDWADLRQRVKGIKEKSAAKLSGNGLTVNGKSLPAGDAGASRAARADKPEKAEKAARARADATLK